MKTLIVCQSYHHGNTKKIADAMAAVLHVEVVSPSDVNAEMLDGYDLVGFGSGIAFEKHYAQILKLVDRLPVFHKNAFATRGGRHLMFYHRDLRRQLKEKGWTIIGEFSSRGYDTYRIGKLLGGIAKGRPNERDVRDAEKFAECLA